MVQTTTHYKTDPKSRQTGPEKSGQWCRQLLVIKQIQSRQTGAEKSGQWCRQLLVIKQIQSRQTGAEKSGQWCRQLLVIKQIQSLGRLGLRRVANGADNYSL